MIESMGRFIGVGLGVVGLSFIAGAQSKKGDDDDDSDEAVSAPKPKSSTSTSTNKPSIEHEQALSRAVLNRQIIFDRA